MIGLVRAGHPQKSSVVQSKDVWGKPLCEPHCINYSPAWVCITIIEKQSSFVNAVCFLHSAPHFWNQGWIVNNVFHLVSVKVNSPDWNNAGKDRMTHEESNTNIVCEQQRRMKQSMYNNYSDALAADETPQLIIGTNPISYSEVHYSTEQH